MGVAWLTPAFARANVAQGVVHSVFRNVANVLLYMDSEHRMFTICTEGLPRIPDAACAPRDWLAHVQVGEPVTFCARTPSLRTGGRMLPLARSPWRGDIPRYPGSLNLPALRRACNGLANGLTRLPGELREAAFGAIRLGDGRRYVGLGCGLTPAFDDACVGAMAVRRALGVQPPFLLSGLHRTTDVSARYLTLAQEGYFGEPLCDAVAALFGEKALEPAIAKLLAVGASSGADMLLGMLLAAKAALQP